jgi:hypothetical protein
MAQPTQIEKPLTPLDINVIDALVLDLRREGLPQYADTVALMRDHLLRIEDVVIQLGVQLKRLGLELLNEN